MKTKYLIILAWIASWMACTPEDAEVYLNPVEAGDVKTLVLAADHETLLPDGKAEMNFRILAYGSKELLVKQKKTFGDSVVYTEEPATIQYLIPDDELPKGAFAVYDGNGKKLEGNVFSTTRTDWETLEFYAEGNGIRSEPLQVKRRDLPADEYEEIVFPVIFHCLVPPYSAKPAYSISTEALESKLERVNNIFNALISENPNGGNAKIRFRLAEYGPDGKLLLEKGKHVINLTSNLANQAAYENYINKTSGMIWNPLRYLNVFICKFSDNWSSDGSSTYVATAPNVILTGSEPIPGITAREVDAFTSKYLTSYKDVGIMLNYEGVLNVNSMEKNNATEMATVFGYYFGLKGMMRIDRWEWVEDENGNYVQEKVSNIVDGDTDYCADTYIYENTVANFTIYKNEYFDGKYYTSFNIMEDYSRKNSITLDQARRIRAVVERCPSRWSYKSDWAFTGRK